jgi:hypothetical protein
VGLIGCRASVPTGAFIRTMSAFSSAPKANPASFRYTRAIWTTRGHQKTVTDR